MSESIQCISWTFAFQLNDPPKEIVQLLLPAEQIEASFKTKPFVMLLILPINVWLL